MIILPNGTTIEANELWFETPDSHTLCRAGGNGPAHPSQLYAIKKYVKPYSSFLDYGAGSATTLEALLTDGTIPVKYKGLDIIPKNVKWCQENFKGFEFALNEHIHKIDEPDKSFDVVYSRHVVDHMASFEESMDEHTRVAKELVIVVLWTGLVDGDEHEIKNIVDQRGLPTEKTFTNEYTNNYSRKKVMEYLNNKEGWELLELTDDVGAEHSGHDTVIVMKRKEVGI